MTRYFLGGGTTASMTTSKRANCKVELLHLNFAARSAYLYLQLVSCPARLPKVDHSGSRGRGKDAPSTGDTVKHNRPVLAAWMSGWDGSNHALHRGQRNTHMLSGDGCKHILGSRGGVQSNYGGRGCAWEPEGPCFQVDSPQKCRSQAPSAPLNCPPVIS